MKNLTPSPPDWISRLSAHNTRILTALDALITCLLPMMKPLKPSKRCACTKGIIPALESSHAPAHALKMMRENPDKEQLLVVNLSGRGDKDIFTVHDILKARGEI